MGLVRWKVFHALIVCLLLVQLQTLGAKDQNFRLVQSDSGVTAIRYRIAEGDWIDVDVQQKLLRLASFNTESDVLDIQQFSPSSGWGPVYSYRYDDSLNTWVGIKEGQRTVRFSISKADDSIVAFRYQVGVQPDGQWSHISADEAYITLPWFDSDLTLFVQQTWDRLNYSDSYAYRYNQSTQTWAMVDKPKQRMESYTIGLFTTAAKTSSEIEHLYQFSYGGGSQGAMSFPFNRRLLLLMQADAQYAPSNNIWTDSFVILGGTLGLGYRYQVAKNLQMVPAVSYGLLAHYSENTCSGTPERTWFVAQQASASLRFEFPLLQSMLTFAGAHATLMIEQEEFGLLYGAAAGIQMAW
jgi:hypothetical protein